MLFFEFREHTTAKRCNRKTEHKSQQDRNHPRNSNLFVRMPCVWVYRHVRFCEFHRSVCVSVSVTRTHARTTVHVRIRPLGVGINVRAKAGKNCRPVCQRKNKADRSVCENKSAVIAVVGSKHGWSAKFERACLHVTS